MDIPEMAIELYGRPKRILNGLLAEGFWHFASGKHDDALRCLKEHIKVNPRDVEAHHFLSATLSEMGRWEDAARCADVPWDKEREIPHLLLDHAEVRHSKGESEKALLTIDAAEKAGAHPSKVCYQRGVITYDMSAKPEHADRIYEAARHIAEACRLDSDNSSYHSTAANILLMKYYQDKTDDDALSESIRHGHAALKLGDKEYQTLFNLGRAYIKLNDFETAISYLEQAVAKDPDDALVYSMLGSCMGGQNGKPQNYYQRAVEHLDRAVELDPSIDMTHDKARALYKFGDITGAIRLLEALAKRRPEDVFVWTRLGDLYIDAGDIMNASKCLINANKLDPSVPTLADRGIVSGLMSNAAMRYMENRLDDALECIDAHIKANPNDVNALYLKAHVLEDMGRWQDAIEWLDQVWDTGSATPSRMLMRARLYGWAGDAQKAFMFIDSAQKAGAPRAEVYFSKGAVMDYITDSGGADMFDEAVECMLEACKLDGDEARYQSAASQILMTKYYRDGCANTDTVKECLRYGQRAVELGDNSHSTYYSIGHAYVHMGDDDEAIKYFEQAIMAYPNFTNAKAMIGTIMSHQKGKSPDHYKRAIRYLEDVLKENPSDESALNDKALAERMRAGDTQDA